MPIILCFTCDHIAALSSNQCPTYEPDVGNVERLITIERLCSNARAIGNVTIVCDHPYKLCTS